MSKTSRAKGQRGEREFGKLLSEKLGVNIERRLGAARDGGCDIILALGGKTYAIEIKHYKKVTSGLIDSWWEQTLEQTHMAYSNVNLVPVLAYRQNHCHYWSICIPLGVLTEALKPYHNIFEDTILSNRITITVDILVSIINHYSEGQGGIDA